MRVCLDFTPAIQAHTGISRYATELARHLPAECPGVELSLFYADSAGRIPPAPFDALPRRVIRQAAKPWRLRVMLNTLLRRPMDSVIGSTDLFHAADHLLPPLTGCKTVFTLYDLTPVKFPQTHSALNRWFSQLMLPRFLRRADKILAISEWTRRDALALYHLPAAKIVAIPLGVSLTPTDTPPEKIRQIQARYNLPPHFLLYVGTIEPRKNLPVLFSALKQANQPDLKLVVVGKKGWLYEQAFQQLQELGLADQVIFTGFTPDEDLISIYRLACAFVFPSLYEGFGLPVLEAMACGAPVLCSNASSLPEVAGEAAILLSPTDVNGWSQAITQIAQNEGLRAQLREAGLRQAARFSWASTARQTGAVYRELLEEK